MYLVRFLRLRIPAMSPCSFKRYNSILGNLFPTCSSCGIKLQSMDRLKPGFYVRSITDRAPVLKSSDKAFDRLMARIDDDDKRLLLNESESSPVVKSSDSSIKAEVKNDKEAISCTRCRDATYKNKFNASEHPVESMESILSNVDPLGNIIHLVNAFDFPLTLNPALFKFREARDIKIVITKADRLFAHSKTANNYGLTFFRDYLNRKYGILPENVFISSGVVDWNIKELLENIPDNSYFIGDVNVGKSTLIKSLIYGDEKFNKRKFTDKKEKITLEKEQDYLINHSNKKTFSSKKVERKFEESFKAKNGPGVSYMPAFTRGNIRFELQNSGKTIFDVPGIGDENHGVFQWIEDTKAIRQVTKGTKVPKRGSYDSKYFTVKGGQCLTVGGIFYVQVPSTSMVQIRNCINEEELVLKSFDKAREVILERKPTLVKKIIVSPESTENLQKFIIPPFYGTVDFVIKNIGHINIKPVGKLIENESPFVVYLPQGVEAIVRKPIMKYIQKSIVGRDKRGNPLAKEHWVTKGIKEIQKFTGEVFYSKLIPVPDEVENLNEYAKAYSENMNKIKIEDNLELEKLLSNYWIEL